MMNFFQKKIKSRRGFTMIEVIAVDHYEPQQIYSQEER